MAEGRRVRISPRRLIMNYLSCGLLNFFITAVLNSYQLEHNFQNSVSENKNLRLQTNSAQPQSLLDQKVLLNKYSEEWEEKKNMFHPESEFMTGT